MPSSESNGFSKVANTISDFLICLVKVIWYILAAMVKTFLPVQRKDVKKDIVLVTGGASGIGRLMAMKFAEMGATVIIWDINATAGEAVVEEIKGRGGSASYYTCDLSNSDSIYQTASKVKRDVGSVTILINNAGIVTGKKFLESTDRQIDMTLKVNTIAHFWTIKAFVPDMISKNHGHIITIASGAGLFGIAGMVDYCASKFAAVGLHESLTMELDTIGCTDVKTLCVCPYFIDTGMFAGIKTRFPWLLPIVSTEYAVSKIIQAFHANKEMLLIPRLNYLFYAIQGFLPKKAMLESARFFGITNTMDDFRGRTNDTSKRD